MKVLITFLLLTFLIMSQAIAGTITLKSGKVIKGDITRISDDEIQIDVGVGFPITYYPYQIDKIGEFKIERLTNKDQPKVMDSKTVQVRRKDDQQKGVEKFKTKTPGTKALKPVAKNSFKPVKPSK